jgi:hypothetical protein
MSIQYVPEYARIVTTNPAPYNLTGSNNILQIKVDGGSTQTVTLTTGGSRTAANIVSDCGVLTGVTPAVVTVNGQDFVSFTTTTSNGSTSSIEVLSPVNNVNATFGIATVDGTPRYSTIIGPVTTKQQIIDATEAALLRVGWSTISGSGSTNLLMQSSMTPQGLRFRLRVRDNGGNNACFGIENVAGTRVGTSNINGIGLIFPASRTYRIIANKYQFFIYEENSGQVNATSAPFRSNVFCGVPWIPSNLTGTLYESIWLIANASSDGDNSTRGSLREVLGSRNSNVGGNGNLTVICNNNIWESFVNSNMNGIGMPCLITIWQGCRIQRQAYSWFRWHDDSEFMVDPLIAWGLTSQNDEAKIRGMLWDSFIQVGGPYEPGLSVSMGGRTFMPITINNYGSNENARGALFTAIS